MPGAPIDAPFRPSRRVELPLNIGVALFAAAWIVLMLRNLGYLSFWLDEGFHFLAAQGIINHGVPLYPSGHMYYKAILYAYVLAGLGKVFGLTETTLRIVSVFCVGGLIFLAWFVGRRFFSRAAGIAAALILTFSAWEVENARLALYFAPLTLMYLAALYVFYQAFVEERPRFKPWVLVLFLLIPQVHQLGMGVYFCYPALLVVKGLKRVLKKDVLLSFGIVSAFYLGMQLFEFFFWKVGYVYEKTDSSLGGMIRYFFSSFNLKYFREFFSSFPLMTLVVLGGIFLYLGTRVRRRGEDGVDRPSPWLYLILCLIFPLLFFGVFRTHVQPRYLAPLHPVFVLLFVVALREAAPVLADLLIRPFKAFAPRTRSVTAWLLFAASVLVLTEGAGFGRTMAIVNRRYNDPLATDIITRSGRQEQEDNRNTALYVKNFLRPEDIVVAIHVVFGRVYAGRVDYWLWSGGPGTWDAWEKTPDGWRDFYVGARWINNLADLKAVIEMSPGRRVWLIGSTSLARRDHINAEISGFLRRQEDRIVFRGWDGISAVYLWNDRSGAFSGPAHTMEGEWLPARRGRVEYGEGASRNAWMAWPAGRREELDADLPGEFAAGRYRISLRTRSGKSGRDGATGTEEAMTVSVLSGRTGQRLRTLRLPAGESESAATFALEEGDRPKLRILVRGTASAALDWIDVLPVGGER